MATWGALQLTLPAFVAAGGGLMLLALAALVAFSRGGARLRLPLAAAIGTQGAFQVVISLLLPDAIGSLWLGLTFAGLSFGAQALLVAALAIELPRRRAALAWGALATVLVVAVVEVALTGSSYPVAAPDALLRAASIAVSAAIYGTFALAAVFALRAQADEGTRAWRALALGFALPASATVGTILGTQGEASAFTFVILLSLVWLAVPGGRLVPSALLATALVTQLYKGTETNGYAVDLHGALAATIGALLLALAVLRDHVADIRAPSFSLRRGPLAAASLALLFVVAQIAQNFFAARYGLLLGGVVAGTFLFAAAPLQRALEGFRGQGPPPLADDRAARRREIYATAVRAARADHVLTREEERALAHLAEELGIGAGEAHDIRREVEDGAR